MTDYFKRVKGALEARDRDFCGDAPEWIIQSLLEIISKFEKRLDGTHDDDVVESFQVGAGKFLAENCNIECGTLGDNICGDGYL